LKPIRERYIRLYMPWRRKRYVINMDDEIATRPCFHFYWHPHPYMQHIGFARWGWQ
jgi:hypothetical protein